MPPLLQCHRISHSAGTKSLFNNLDFTINEADKVGLVGFNGAGKSTLLSILNQSCEADEGDISRSRQLQLESVEQFISIDLMELTLLEALLDKLSNDEKDFGEYKVQQCLQELGFSPAEFDYKVADLSGGQQNRLMFARAIINAPNLILFDEPTNHLDLQTLLFFEAKLKSFKAAFVLVSHDRAFLDAVTNRTVFIRDERSYNFSMPYSEAKTKLDEQDAADAARLKQEEKTIKSLAESAKRLAIWGKVYDSDKLAAKAKTMERRIEKLQESKTFVSKGSNLSLTLDVGTSRANKMLHIENRVIESPGDNPHQLFSINEFYIRPGDRIALLGHNGVGKTTFIKLIMAQYAKNFTGDFIKFNPQCDIGYYDQEMAGFSAQLSLLETLRKHCHRGTESEYKASLIKAGFEFRDHDKKIKVLSGGEKSRMMFLIIKINQPNFLILDEPTNHIDIQGKEELEQQILATNATALITSHDRMFVDTIAQRYALIIDGQLKEINDPNSFYVESRTKRAAQSSHSVDSVVDVANQDENLSSDAILERIMALEILLEDDRARKPKFQKLDRQALWNEELEQLNQSLSYL